MKRKGICGNRPRVVLALAALAFCLPDAHGAEPIRVFPAKMPRAGTVDERFQSYNVEMVEVTGGRFWAPYGKQGGATAANPPAAQLSTPGIDPSLFRTRPPIKLASPRLRKLASALGPAYMRVSGSWANSTWFQDSDDPPPTAPPAGFGGILTRPEWRGVIDFSRTVNARIVTSFAISAGVRDANGAWTPDQARKLLNFTKTIGGSIAAAELFNEPTLAAMGGAPKGYDAAAYGRDFKVFLSFARESAPDMLILGPGSIGEAAAMGSGFSMLRTTMLEDYLAVPFTTALLGVDVVVEKIDLTENEEIVALCRRGKQRQRIPILELPLPQPPPAGSEWIDAYRRWARQTSD